MRLGNTTSLFLVLCALLVPGIQAGWSTEQTTRKLYDDEEYRYDDEEYGFVWSLLNGTAFCFTSHEHPQRFDLVRSRVCDFADSPATQLWRHDDGKFISKVDSSLCMRIYGSNLYEHGSSRVRVTPCGEDTSLNLFDFEGDKIVVREDNSFCLTSHGAIHREGAPMIARACAKKPRFRFWFETPDDGTTGFCNDDADPVGCLVVADEDPVPGQKLILGHPDLNHNWKSEVDTNLFRTALDFNMCMQAGNGSGPPTEGTSLRLYPCDETNPLQHFDYEGVDIIHVGSGLCVGFRGDSSHVNVDPIILKDCELVGNNWSTDG
ncbi:expressed unknown protein [Seminavis robusta]|uniref:Ricin B lectin domain-containing protein n=1 Tax=Seminavis robusta TaxID=568900 RepID=A0A9N8HTF5_9STRA|nr:expressed unknown protein [Seminavis robusta]|eukprot:Sro1269_g257880.1 n/a (320) ;mRNA; r:19620-20579